MKMNKKHKSWVSNSAYYTTEFYISPQKEKMHMLHLDSNYMLCYLMQTVDGAKNYTKLLDHRTAKIYENHCNKNFTKSEQGSADDYKFHGKEQWFWMKKQMKKAANNPEVKFKGIVMHHPMFTLYYDDYMPLVYYFNKKIRKYGYDVYFAGMEQQLNYANYPLDQSGTGRSNRKIPKDIDKNETCYKRSEFFPRGGPEKQSRFVMTSQGEYVNQITSGAAGKTTFPVCQWNMLKSHGNFVYGQSKHNGFVLAHASKDMLDIKWIGV